ncbi:hypothetical protein BC834DRAFT_99745 [Gloeopeniophorella convolvens]|nr:hypothetical protein BC834DRAFT_99745 [Gloeopeniophorella convolvens]
MSSQLLSLSPELLVYIISYLSLEDIVSCELSCSHLHEIVKTSALFQYLKEAGRAGVRDLLTTSLTLPERFEKLRMWAKKWEGLDISEASARITFDLETWSPLVGSLHNGYLITTDEEPLIYAYSDLSSTPSTPPPHILELCNITRATNGLMHIFAFADEYDLAVTLTKQQPNDAENNSNNHPPQASTMFLDIRMLTLSKSTAHPLAKKPQIIIPLESQFFRGCLLDAKLTGNYLAIVTSHGWIRSFDEVYLVFWKDGVVHRIRRSPPNTYFPQVTFLSEDTLIFVQKQGNALELCKITLDDPPGLDTLCVLGLPTIQSGITCVMAECQGDRVVAPQAVVTRAHHLPFTCDPDAVVLCFTFALRQVISGLDHIRSVSFWVRRRALCDYAARGGGQKHTWEAWGPPATRWTDWQLGQAPCRPGGTRGALFSLLMEVGSGMPIVIRDFHPHRVRRALSRSRSPGWNGTRCKVVTEPSKIHRGSEFVEDIVSSLPYYEVTSEKRYGYHEVLVDDERVVGITRGDDEGTIDIHIMT